MNKKPGPHTYSTELCVSFWEISLLSPVFKSLTVCSMQRPAQARFQEAIIPTVLPQADTSLLPQTPGFAGTPHPRGSAPEVPTRPSSQDEDSHQAPPPPCLSAPCVSPMLARHLRPTAGFLGRRKVLGEGSRVLLLAPPAWAPGIWDGGWSSLPRAVPLPRLLECQGSEAAPGFQAPP